MGETARKKRSAARPEAAKGQKTTAPAEAAAGGAVRPRRKNLILDQNRIDRARAALGAATETETITRALDQAIDLAAFRAELDAGWAKVGGKGGIENVFDDPEALDWSGFADVFPSRAAKSARRRQPGAGRG
jgi:hypothetical protein